MDSLDNLRQRFEALEQRTHAMAMQTRIIARRLRWWPSLACGLVGLAVLTWAAGSIGDEVTGSSRSP